MKSTFRYLFKQKWYTFINILGLSIGFVAFIIIFIFIQKEKSYDNFHEDAENIYRLEEKWNYGAEEQHSAAANSYLVPAVVDNYPEVESGIRLIKAIWPIIMNYGEQRFPEEKFCFADSTFFNFFSFKLIEGDPGNVLKSPTQVVLTQSTAKKYFGNEYAVGKHILYNGNDTFTVSGIIEDMPKNSHFHFDLIFPLQYMARFFSERDKEDLVFYSYVQLSKGTDYHSFAKRVNNDIISILGFQDKLSQGDKYEVFFQPLLDIHLKGRAEREIEVNGNELFIIILQIVAFFLLAVAGIN